MRIPPVLLPLAVIVAAGALRADLVGQTPADQPKAFIDGTGPGWRTLASGYEKLETLTAGWRAAKLQLGSDQR